MGVVNVRGWKFGDLCRSRGIKQEFTTVDSPQFNGVAECALGLIETAAMVEFRLVSVFPERNCRQLRRCGLKRRTGRAML